MLGALWCCCCRRCRCHYKASRGNFVAKCAANKGKGAEKDWKSFKSCTPANRFVVEVEVLEESTYTHTNVHW